MSELIDNTEKKKQQLKELIRELHKSVDAASVKERVAELLGEVPYGLVVEVEQELMNEGLPHEEVINLCDLHGEVLKGNISLAGMKPVLPGHPVDTFMQENRALEREMDALRPMLAELDSAEDQPKLASILERIRPVFNSLMDVDVHYRRKENLVFPYLEKYGVTGPPTVMWAKHDQIREQMKAASDVLKQSGEITIDEVFTISELVLKPALKGIQEMVFKEEQILFPMCLDRLTDVEWFEVARQSPEIGFCLFDPIDEWQPDLGDAVAAEAGIGERIQLPSGSFSLPELTAALNTLPVDMTWVDKDDTVRYFTQGSERIFDRNRAILGRKVQFCHPPSSVHVVQTILDDFRAGREDKAAFWIQLHGKFIHIEYFAVRSPEGDYLGTIEVSQDLTAKRALTGEQRILDYHSLSPERPEPAGEHNAGTVSPPLPHGAPAWLDLSRVAESYDARQDLAAGVHPAQKVMSALGSLPEGALYELVTPFAPAPLIDKAKALGFAAWHVQESADTVRTYFTKA